MKVAVNLKLVDLEICHFGSFYPQLWGGETASSSAVVHYQVLVRLLLPVCLCFLLHPCRPQRGIGRPTTLFVWARTFARECLVGFCKQPRIRKCGLMMPLDDGNCSLGYTSNFIHDFPSPMLQLLIARMLFSQTLRTPQVYFRRLETLY